jgi:hypothetical protein
MADARTALAPLNVKAWKFHTMVKIFMFVTFSFREMGNMGAAQKKILPY